MSIDVVSKDGINKLSINNNIIEQSSLMFDPYGNQIICEINDEDVAQEIIKYNTERLLLFRRLRLKPLIRFKSKIILNLDISLRDLDISKDLEEVDFFIYLTSDSNLWDNPFTYSEYKEIFLTNLHKLKLEKNVKLTVKDTLPEFEKLLISDGQEIEFYIIGNLNSNTISELVNDLLINLTEYDSEIFEILIENNNSRQINSIFSFPDNIKNSCEQYLLYFAQFLQDLGINATSNLKEEAGKVLFSVTPTDDVEALDKIREALAVYLKLPESPIVYDDSFAAMRLQQQIENLQHSQKMAVREIQVNEKLLLAQSDMIREKNITISQQQTVIENQTKVIEKISSKSIMMDSVENKEELEEVYDGLKIGESKFLKEQLGIHLNPAKVIKTAVKSTFGKDVKNSILGLNEES